MTESLGTVLNDSFLRLLHDAAIDSGQVIFRLTATKELNCPR